MAILYITEFAALGGGNQSDAQAVAGPPIQQQNLAIGGSNVVSSAVNTSSRIVRIACDTTCSIVVGGNSPVATANAARMQANQTEYFAVAGGIDKIAVITNT